MFNDALWSPAGNGMTSWLSYVMSNFPIGILGQVYSTLVYATNGAPSECQQHWPEYGGRDLQSYTV